MIKKDIECAHCKILINTNNPDLNYRYDGHTYLCDSCFDTDYCVCDFCWKFVKVGEQTNINDHIHGDLHMCKECREEVTIICFCCNKVIKYEEAIFYRKQNFCQECMNLVN